MATTLRRKFSHNVGTVATQLGAYTAPSVTTGVFITGLVCANTTGGTVTVTVDIFDGTTHVQLCNAAPVPAGASVMLADNSHRIVLNANDQVFVTSNTATSIDATMSLMEIQ